MSDTRDQQRVNNEALVFGDGKEDSRSSWLWYYCTGGQVVVRSRRANGVVG